MRYIRAEDVLPPEVLALVQKYVDGKMLYVPKRPFSRDNWGAASGTKEYYANRNAAICAEFKNGAARCELAERYFLSEKSIQRILRMGARSCCSEDARKREDYEP